MNELRDGIEHARAAIQKGLRGPVVMPDPWEEVVDQLEAALAEEAKGDRRAALGHLDVATGHLKMLALTKRGTFELFDMEEVRRDALKALNHVPRAI